MSSTSCSPSAECGSIVGTTDSQVPLRPSSGSNRSPSPLGRGRDDDLAVLPRQVEAVARVDASDAREHRDLPGERLDGLLVGLERPRSGARTWSASASRLSKFSRIWSVAARLETRSGTTRSSIRPGLKLRNGIARTRSTTLTPTAYGHRVLHHPRGLAAPEAVLARRLHLEDPQRFDPRTEHREDRRQHDHRRDRGEEHDRHARVRERAQVRDREEQQGEQRDHHRAPR